MDDDSKSLLDSNEDAILKSPEENKSISLSKPAEPTVHRKITLKRNLTAITPLATSTTTAISVEKPEIDAKRIKLDITADTEIVDGIKDNDDENTDIKIVKLKELTIKERLELRAKKFGAPVDSDIKKLARAERFGTQNESNGNKASITSNAVPASADILKKRAQRFGVSVSTQMINIENQEKLQKRQERFNAGATTKTTITPPESSDEYAEKARLRLERFKPVVK